MDRRKLLRLVNAAVMMALSCVLTLVVQIPTPSKGYLNLGDCAVLLGGWLLGPVYGPVAGGLGSALADVMLGYPVYAPGTLVIKALTALVAALLRPRAGERPRARAALAFGLGELVMVAGYYLYEALLQGFSAALLGVPGNLLQGLVCAIVAWMVCGPRMRGQNAAIGGKS